MYPRFVRVNLEMKNFNLEELTYFILCQGKAVRCDYNNVVYYVPYTESIVIVKYNVEIATEIIYSQRSHDTNNSLGVFVCLALGLIFDVWSKANYKPLARLCSSLHEPCTLGRNKVINPYFCLKF